MSTPIKRAWTLRFDIEAEGTTSDPISAEDSEAITEAIKELFAGGTLHVRDITGEPVYVAVWSNEHQTWACAACGADSLRLVEPDEYWRHLSRATPALAVFDGGDTAGLDGGGSGDYVDCSLCLARHEFPDGVDVDFA